MRQKRVFALVYRLIAFLACLAGVLNALGLFSGNFSAEILLYYTTESNLLVLTMFALLLCRTAIDIKEHGTVGPASYFERLETIVTLAITLTLVVFWGLLAPGSDLSFLFSYHNLQIHLITPLLMIFDYFLFVTPGKMKKQDPLIFALIPVAYLVQAYSVAFSGFVYSSDLGAGQHFPYYFLDYYQLHALVLVYILALLVFVLSLGFLLLWLDRKRSRSLPT